MSAPSRRAPDALDAARLREEFPILHQTVRGRPLVYLDNGATTQKPRAVIDATVAYYERDNANVHRGVHLLSQRATAAFEGAREKVARFLGAASAREIVFTRGTTEAINLVAWSFGRTHVGAGDEVLITAMEHHSNIVPWQMLCAEKGARLRVAPIDDDGALRMDAFASLLGPRTKLVSVLQVSNALGTVLPAREICALARERGVPVLVDGAQAVAHTPVDVRSLGCDFYAFSGHKLYGPTGIGALWGRGELLDAMPPWQGGGEMIASVTFEQTLYNVVPHKFEAGTPDIAGAVGLGAAIDWVSAVGLERISAHEHDLLGYATEALRGVPGVRLVGTAREKAAVLSFVMDGVHPHDIGTVLDQEGVAIRTGHHCAQPVMDRFGVPATARASFAAYNTRDDVDALVKAVHKVRELFA
ncbi:MAG TPA: cysteine desulfurase [Myxococcota bacterium]|jgi:cysteine desulfurase/selenocysteine lyase|nr:cysteine desulfurase [Myxococcota bacterium]